MIYVSYIKSWGSGVTSFSSYNYKYGVNYSANVYWQIKESQYERTMNRDEKSAF